MCESCGFALIAESPNHQYLSLVAMEDGGLVYPSKDVVKVLGFAERVFRQFVSTTSADNTKVNSTKKLRLKLLTKTVYEATIANVFETLFQHDMQFATNLDEDLHSTQLIKEIKTKFLNMRLARHGQDYVMQQKDAGKRHHTNKMLLFSGY